MFVTTPEIVWHNKEPVFSLDFHHNGSFCRIATAGADQTVKIWKVLRDECRVKFVFLTSLDRHSKSVNAVRFAPNGEYLASAGDDCVICLWKLSEANGENNLVAVGDGNNQESWSAAKMLRGHLEDVYDLCWSPDSKYLVSGSVDNSAIVWNCSTGEKISILKESHHYIQGVAWGCGGYLATLGTDRCMRVYNSKFKCVHSVMKRVSVSEDKAQTQADRLFHDEGVSSFFRRLSFSPDGLILVAPSGKLEGCATPCNATWVFTVSSLPKPVLYLSGADKPSLVVRFSPVLYELRPEIDIPLFDLPYRMVFAVGTTDTVILYDTQQATPIGLISDIHYTSVTDLSWSDDGLILMVSSSDGFCTVIGMTTDELGTPYIAGQTQNGSDDNLVVTPPDSSSPVNLTVNDIAKPSRRITPVRMIPPPAAEHCESGGLKAKTRRVNFTTLSSENNDR